MTKSSPYLILIALLLLLSLPFPSVAHGPEGHSTDHKDVTTPHDEIAMKAQHERMGKFKGSMQALLEAIIHGNQASAQNQVKHLSEALRGHEKDMPHKNNSQVKEFQALYGELNKGVGRLAVDAKAPDLSKLALSYGKVLDTCVNCHRKFRD